MSINRDDLLAAARAGRLHYAEIDNLLIFLMQRQEQLNRAGAAASPMRCFAGSLLATSFATLCAILVAPAWANSLVVFAVVPFIALCVLCRMVNSPSQRRRGTDVLLRLMAVLLVVMMPIGVMGLEAASHYRFM